MTTKVSLVAQLEEEKKEKRRNYANSESHSPH
jgi:hypothetical protein